MKNTFPGYRKKTDEEIKNIWSKGTICFDANVLLNLYRYSNNTRKTIIELIQKLKKNIWLPHQAALEYNRNRYEVIAAQEKAYKEFIDKISQIEKDLQSTSKPPFLSDRVHSSLNKVFKDVNKEVEDSIKKYCDLLKDDPIYDELSEIFQNKISNPFTEEILTEIYSEGKERFEKKIPPGYEDEKNKKGDRKYGDLVLWKQIIEKAKESKKPIIFITDERKTDWWWKIKDGRNMGPRQELAEEIMREANVEFHMYSSERFLSYGLSYLEEQVNKKALAELQEMKRSEMAHLRNQKKRDTLDKAHFEQKMRFQDESKFFEIRLEEFNHKIKSLKNHMRHLEMDDDENPEVREYLHNNSRHLHELIEERNELTHRLDQLSSQKDKWYLRKERGRFYSGEETDKNN